MRVMANWISLAMIVAGVIIAGLSRGVLHGSWLGGIVAAAGLLPAAYAAWQGAQQEEQGPMARAVVLIFLSVGVGGALIVLRLINYF